MVIDQELREDVDKFLSKVKSEITAPELDDKEKPLDDNSDALITKDDHNVSSNTEPKHDIKEDTIIEDERVSVGESCEKNIKPNVDTNARVTEEELSAFEPKGDDFEPREEKTGTPVENEIPECQGDITDLYDTGALGMDVNCEEDIDTPETESMNMGVSIAKMRERNSEFDRCMTPVERACKELRFGAQLELMLKFEANRARCLMCGKILGTEFLIMKHLQLKHKDEYERLRTVLEITNMNTLNMFVHKAIRSEFLFQQKEIFPISVDY